MCEKKSKKVILDSNIFIYKVIQSYKLYLDATIMTLCIVRKVII